MPRKFKWDVWDYDCSGPAYIIAKDECPNIEDVPKYIVEADCLHKSVLEPPDHEHAIPCGDTDDEYLCVSCVHQGYCKYQVRCDWDNVDGPQGGYYVTEQDNHPTNPITGRPLTGWFPVWIVRLGLWY